MQVKNKKCQECVYNDDAEFKNDCAQCEDGSGFLSREDFLDDMDFWCGGDWRELEAEENKLKYFLIRWLIKFIIKFNAEDFCDARFKGIVFKPLGNKQLSELPFCLSLFIRHTYVDQWRDGGMSGDDFAGSLYYGIFPFVYLMFDYEC